MSAGWAVRGVRRCRLKGCWMPPDAGGDLIERDAHGAVPDERTRKTPARPEISIPQRSITRTPARVSWGRKLSAEHASWAAQA